MAGGWIIAIIVFVSIIVGINIYLICAGDWDGTGFMMSLLMGVASLLIIGLATIFMFVCAETKYKVEPIERIKTTEIYALEDNVVSYVHRYCSDDNITYSYIYQDELGMRSATIKDTHTYIQFGDKDTHYLEEWRGRFTNKFYSWYFGDRTIYIFVIPEGSVIQESYNIDLE